MAFTLSDSQHVPLTITPVDKKGNPATISSVPVWSVDNPNLLALTPSADGLSCDIASVGPLGSAKVSVSVAADATLPALIGELDVTINGGAATTVTIVPGTPTEQ